MSDRTHSTFTKPLLTVAALGAAAAFLGVYKITRGRPRAGWMSPRAAQPTLLGAMARSALVSAAASLSSYVMNRLQRSLERDDASQVGLPGADEWARSAEST